MGETLTLSVSLLAKVGKHPSHPLLLSSSWLFLALAAGIVLVNFYIAYRVGCRAINAADAAMKQKEDGEAAPNANYGDMYSKQLGEPGAVAKFTIEAPNIAALLSLASGIAMLIAFGCFNL